jgi:hypothetical protein
MPLDPNSHIPTGYFTEPRDWAFPKILDGLKSTSCQGQQMEISSTW